MRNCPLLENNHYIRVLPWSSDRCEVTQPVVQQSTVQTCADVNPRGKTSEIQRLAELDMRCAATSQLCVLCALGLFSMVRAGDRRTYLVRQTEYGKVRGFVDRVYNDREVEKYLGIPYARTPTGRLRFAYPEPPLAWGDRIKDALSLPAACLQPNNGYNNHYVPDFKQASEDCLYLNIYTPRISPMNKALPVLIFVHGGSYLQGMGAMFDGSFLALEEIVVVNFNYRLGPIGFLSAGDSDFPGNYGMLDQVQAFRWVQGNIDSFGGDPNQVTIDGHSAGGCSVGLHLISPLTKGLFSRVIQQSGSPLAHWAVSNYEKEDDFHFKIFSSELGCLRNTTIEIKNCLQNIDKQSFERLLDISSSSSLVPDYRPVMDNYYLPDTPENLIKNQINANEFMTGATKDEGLHAVDAYFNLFNYADNSAKKILDLMHCFRGDLPDVKDIIGLVLEEYTPRTYIITNDIEVRKTFSEIVGDFFITAPTHLSAHILSTKNVSVYVYDFGYQSAFDDQGGKYPFPTGVPTPDGAIHGAELVYLTGAPMVGHKYLRFDESDKKMSEMLLMLWGNFVKQGIPSLSRPQQDFHIRRYTVSSPDYAALFNESGTPVIEMSSNLKPDKMAFWNFKVPQMYREQFGGLTPEVVRFPEAGHVNRKVPTWGLTTACVSLAVLSSLLAVLYCRTRRQVKRLIKQTSASSGTCKTNHV